MKGLYLVVGLERPSGELNRATKFQDRDGLRVRRAFHAVQLRSAFNSPRAVALTSRGALGQISKWALALVVWREPVHSLRGLEKSTYFSHFVLPTNINCPQWRHAWLYAYLISKGPDVFPGARQYRGRIGSGNLMKDRQTGFSFGDDKGSGRAISMRHKPVRSASSR